LTTEDNRNATNTEAIAHVIGELKRRYHARQVVVAGHSGGAAIAANILGRHPALIDAALLVYCHGRPLGKISSRWLESL
jgi:alpha-beta hydrolase superfamily lysophospholipase